MFFIILVPIYQDGQEILHHFIMTELVRESGYSKIGKIVNEDLSDQENIAKRRLCVNPKKLLAIIKIKIRKRLKDMSHTNNLL